MISYHTQIEQYSQNTNIQSGFNSAVFINSGLCNLTLNGATLTPGQSLTVEGNAGEIDVTNQYNVVFILTGNSPQITVVKKIYNGI